MGFLFEGYEVIIIELENVNKQIFVQLLGVKYVEMCSSVLFKCIVLLNCNHCALLQI